jgi:hypothetical protein
VLSIFGRFDAVFFLALFVWRDVMLVFLHLSGSGQKKALNLLSFSAHFFFARFFLYVLINGFSLLCFCLDDI